MSDVCVVINEATPDQRRKKTSSDVAESASSRHPTMATEEDDADDEEDDEQDESDSEGRFASRASVATTSQALDLEGSIVVGGPTVRRRNSVCSSCGTYTSGSSRSCDGSHDGDSCTSSRSTRGYSPTRASSGGDQDEESNLPYPAFRDVTMFCLKQTSHPRDWCLKLVNNPYPFGFVHLMQNLLYMHHKPSNQGKSFFFVLNSDKEILLVKFFEQNKYNKMPLTSYNSIKICRIFLDNFISF